MHTFAYIFQNGLNVLNEPFNSDPNVSCGKGGLYFTDKDNIHKFFSYGTNIREITLPSKDEHPDFQIIANTKGNKWLANKIILGKKYSLFDDATYEIFNLDIMTNKNIFILACKYGRIDFMERMKEKIKNMSFFYNDCDAKLKNAICKNHVNCVEVLDWLKLNYELLPLHYKILKIDSPNNVDNNFIECAITNSNTKVLQWLKNNKYFTVLKNICKCMHLYIFSNVFGSKNQKFSIHSV